MLFIGYGSFSTRKPIRGISPFFAYEKQLRLLEKYLQERRVVGIKLFCGHEQFYLHDERLLPVYDLASTYPLSQ